MEFINSDYHARLRAALSSRFASVSWQRCQFLLQRNAMAFVPRAEGTADLRVILDSPERTEAECRLQLVAEKYKARGGRTDGVHFSAQSLAPAAHVEPGGAA